MDLIKKNWSKLWITSAFSISLLCLFATYYQDLLSENDLLYYLTYFDLSTENNLGAWWSGILLFIASLHAFDGYYLYRERYSSSAKGWIAISIILLALSADEIGSIHERTNSILHLGTWLSILPFALILFLLIVYGLYKLWCIPDLRFRVIWIGVAHFLFLGVALQEYLEFNSHWWGQYDNLRLIIEESTELIAFLIILLTTMKNSQGIFNNKSSNPYPVFEVISAHRNIILTAGLVFALPIAYLTAYLPDQYRGHPSDWLASIGFVMAGLVISFQFFRNGKSLNIRQISLSCLSLILSAISIRINYHSSFSKFLFIFSIVSFSFILWNVQLRDKKIILISFFVLLLASNLLLTIPSNFYMHFYFALSSFLFYYLHSLLSPKLKDLSQLTGKVIDNTQTN